MKPNLSFHISHGKLSAYLDEELSAKKRSRVESHLGRCPQCRARLRALGELRQAFYSLRARLKSSEAPLPPWSGIEAEIRCSTGASPLFPRWLKVASGVSSAAVVAGALYYYFKPVPPVTELAVVSREPAELYQYVGDRLFAPEKLLVGDAVAIRPELEEAVFPREVYFHDRSWS
ncbi:MAG TPA: zf-HC2 domain-containing protein [Candidatus Acidoferrales bacterium]|nr:zf-HC2 domain-containing protein [Candidatus Acidoferrales bacterium]